MSTTQPEPISTTAPPAWPFVVMLITPALFSTNIVFGRFVSGETTPFLLASIRWLCVGLLLAPFAFRDLGSVRAFLRANGMRLLLLGFLGMGVCGGGVYLGLQYTTATNATLVYSTAPLLIIALEGLFRGRRTTVLEVLGTIIAFAGVAVIVARGSWETVTSLSFNTGDLLIALAALSWAVYSLLYKTTDTASVKPVTLFALLALAGALVNAPLGIYELATAPTIPDQTETWLAIVGIVLISSLLAFSGFQYGIRTLGPSLAGIFMYLMTPFGVLLAILFLGETLENWHIWGITAVIGGIILAVRPWQYLR